MDWMIYGDLDFMADILNGLALLTAGVGGAGGDFNGLLELAMLVGAFSTVVTGLASGGRINWIPLLAVFLVFMALLAPKRTVTMESVYTGQTRTVANIPLGVAFAGSLLSRIGYYLTATTESVFSYPGLTMDGFQESLETWRVVRQSAINPSSYGAANTVGGGDFARSWTNYVSTCTAFGMDIGNLTPTAIESGALPHLVVLNPNPALGAEIFVGGGVGSSLDCVAAHAQLLSYSRTQFIPALKSSVLTPLLFRPQREQAPTLVSVEDKLTALRTLAGSLVSNDEFLLALYVGSLYDYGIQRRMSLDGMTDYSIMVGDAIRARNAQWRAEGDIFTVYLLPAVGFLEGFFYAMTPLVIVIAALQGPGGVRTIGNYMKIGLWIQLWAPVLSVTNLYVFHAVAGDLANLDGAALVSTSIAGAFSADSVVQQYMATAGLFAASAPFLALAVLTGSVYTLNSLAGRISGPDTISESVAARPRLANDALYTGFSHFGIDAASGVRAPDAASLLPTYQVSSTRSESVESARRESAGARTAFLQSIDKAFSRSWGSEGRSFSEGAFTESTASRGSDTYRFMRQSGLDDAASTLESAGFSRQEALNYTLGAAVNAAANGGRVSPSFGAAREISERAGITNSNEFVSRVNRSMSEHSDGSAELATAMSSDQRRGWTESGFNSSGFTESEAVRQSGERFAGAERSYQEAVASSVSAGATQTVTTPYLSQQIARDDRAMTAFENRLRDHGLFGDAMRWADLYRSQDIFPPGRQGRDQALVAGGLKAMSAANREDLLDATLAPFGLNHVGAGDPSTHRGVGVELGVGPTVSLGGGAPGGLGYAGRDDLPGSDIIRGDHGARVSNLQSEAEAAASRVVASQGDRQLVTQERLQDDRSTASSVAGWLSNYADATVGAVRGFFGGAEGWASHVDGFRQHALAEGLTPVQAELYAHDKSFAGRIGISPDPVVRERLVDGVLSEYHGQASTGEAAVKMIERAVGMTDAGGREPLGELRLQNERFELDLPRGERGLAGRALP